MRCPSYHTATVSVGGPLWNSLTGAAPALGVNVFVNGQLMHSGTEANRAAGTADYNLRDGTITAVDMRFAFAIQADDVVSVVVS